MLNTLAARGLEAFTSPASGASGGRRAGHRAQRGVGSELVAEQGAAVEVHLDRAGESGGSSAPAHVPRPGDS